MRIVPSLLLSVGFATLSVAEEAVVTPAQPAAAPVVAEPVAVQQASPVSPSGLPINDVRFTFGLSVTDDATFTVNSTEWDADFDTWTAAIQVMRSLGPWGAAGGLLYGGEFFYSDSNGEASIGSFGDVRLDYSTYGFTGHLGWGYPLANLPVHIEATLFGSIGKATTTLSEGGDGIDGSDYLHAYGLRAASYYTFSDRHQLGLDLRYTFKSETEPVLGGEVGTEITNSGLSVALGGGYRY